LFSIQGFDQQTVSNATGNLRSKLCKNNRILYEDSDSYFSFSWFLCDWSHVLSNHRKKSLFPAVLLMLSLLSRNLLSTIVSFRDFVVRRGL
jgi:hypothetical protein